MITSEEIKRRLCDGANELRGSFIFNIELC